MAIITSQTTVVIDDALSVITSVDILLLPSNNGINARRELAYPNSLLPPLIYDRNPDQWTNFDTVPLVKRPTISVQPTLTDNRLTSWLGYNKDSAITETWKGSDSVAPMRLDFFRLLYMYYESPPSNGFITWSPKDRTVAVYNIVIEKLSVGGTEIRMDYVPSRHGFLTQDVTFVFRIIGEA